MAVKAVKLIKQKPRPARNINSRNGEVERQRVRETRRADSSIEFYFPCGQMFNISRLGQTKYQMSPLLAAKTLTSWHYTAPQ